ncbi:hypothetical protein [Absidia glauca]|uniref:Uncharacterized protein n=1 Tax=Absidia glauca TaxID=4829 RepID=A0A163MH35_ABSGL|nr:hypothetical protein [Absidia glauca]
MFSIGLLTMNEPRDDESFLLVNLITWSTILSSLSLKKNAVITVIEGNHHHNHVYHSLMHPSPCPVAIQGEEEECRSLGTIATDVDHWKP